MSGYRRRKIKLRLRSLLEAFVLHIGRHADHFRRSRPSAHDHVFAHGVFVRPELTGEGFIYDDNFRSTCAPSASAKVRPLRKATFMVSNHLALIASISMNGRCASGTSSCPSGRTGVARIES